jgi:DNA-directed RNA polymerase subunit RPC12/RpoP
MSEISKDTVCSDCGTPIDGALDTSGERAACTKCGSTRRTHNVCVTERVTVRDGYGLKAKRAGQKKPFVEAKRGPSHSHKLGKAVEHERVIDRENDSYTEKVTVYETGEVIHQANEPLSSHRNHGSAKKKP